MKYLLSIVLVCSSLFGAFGLGNEEFLEPEEAFKTTFVESSEGLKFEMVLGKDIYLYHDKIKVSIKEPKEIDISSAISLPPAIRYDEFDVVFHGLSIDISEKLLLSKIQSNSYNIEVKFQGCSKAGLCYPPIKKSYLYKTKMPMEAKELDKSLEDKKSSDSVELKEIDKSSLSESDMIVDTLKNSGIVITLFTFFVFGLLLSLTPCVFPMIPILSSIIVNANSKGKITTKRALFLSIVYVLSMSLAYTIAGVIAGLFGANLQVALQNPYVLVVFAAIFVALAFSLFGYFSLELPKSIQSRFQSNKSGVGGVAFMGFFSALVVGPCVAPPLAGALVYIGQTGDALLGGMALFVLSLGMGLPLLLVGVGAGKFMPKPGHWMEQVSKVFALLMLGVAIWMLDRVTPNFTLFLYSALCIGAAIYFYSLKHIVIKTICALLFIYGTTLFIGGISGSKNIFSPLDRFTSSKVLSEQTLSWVKVKNIEELDRAVASSSKPVMLDFYASWCISCKELEEITFKDERVNKILKNFTLLKADVTEDSLEDKELQKRFNLFGPPALIFFKDGKEIKGAKIVGYKTPDEFLQILERNHLLK